MTTKIDKVEKEVDSKIKEENKNVSLITKQATKAIVIKSDKDLSKASEFLIKIKGQLKELETERKTFTAPINESLTRLNKRFAELTDPLKDAESKLKVAILDYKKEREVKRIEDEKKLQKENGNTDIAITDRVPDIIETQSGELRTRKTWTFKIVDITKVPKEYLTVDDKKVKTKIKEGERKIKGLEIYQEETLSAYGN